MIPHGMYSCKFFATSQQFMLSFINKVVLAIACG